MSLRRLQVVERFDPLVFYAIRLPFIMCQITRQFPLVAQTLSRLPDGVQSRLKPKTIEKGQVLVRQGQTVDGLYLIAEGRLLVAYEGGNGEGGALAFMDEGDVIGDLELFSDPTATCSIFAPQSAKVLVLSHRDAQQYGRDNPVFLHFLLEQLRLKLKEASMANHRKSMSVRARVALYLDSAANDKGEVVLLRRTDLASLLGTTQRHLGRVLREMCDDSIIALHRNQVQVLRRDLLTI